MLSNYIFFVTSFMFVLLLVWKIPALNNAMQTFVNKTEGRAFPSSSPFEYNKFALLRVLFGAVIFLRGIDVVDLLLYSELNTVIGYYAIAEMLAGLMLVIGLFSQWALLFLIGVMWQIGDQVLGKSTLGNDIGAMLALLLILVNAGKFLSLDSLLINKMPALHGLMLYYRGVPSRAAIFYAKFAALTSYWAVCIYSLSMHLNEAAWMSGIAGPLLLTNNFMANFHIEFTELFTRSSMLVFLARVSLWLMMLWYIFVLPFVLIGGYFRKYIIVWGWLFFALSFFMLQLGYLAEIEAILWLALFWSYVGMRNDNCMDVLYDDRCNLCDRTVQLVTILDIFGRIRLKPLSKNTKLVTSLGLNLEEALTDLYGVCDADKKLFRGYDFYIQLSKSLVLLWPLLPILLLGKIFIIGPVVYRFIASKRRQIFGMCILPRKKYTVNEQRPVSHSRIPITLTLHVCFLTILYLVMVPAPYLNGYKGFSNLGGKAAHIYGITPINVFNMTDLRMAENWFVLKSDDFDQTVPLLSEDGSRLQMHKSDRIYFGHTLKFRRAAIGKEGCHYEDKKKIIDYISKIYLQSMHADPGFYNFSYSQLHQPLVSTEDLEVNLYPPKKKPVIFCDLKYKVTYP